MHTIIVNQTNDYSQYIQFNITLNWIVHHTQSGYMDRYRWLKATTQLFTICGASTINNQIIFFDGYGSHFYNHAVHYKEDQNIQPLFLKRGDYENNQLNDNVLNAKLMSHYNDTKASWMLKYVTKNILPHHMKSIFLEAWDTFKVFSSNTIRGIFVK